MYWWCEWFPVFFSQCRERASTCRDSDSVKGDCRWRQTPLVLRFQTQNQEVHLFETSTIETESTVKPSNSTWAASYMLNLQDAIHHSEIYVSVSRMTDLFLHKLCGQSQMASFPTFPFRGTSTSLCFLRRANPSNSWTKTPKLATI